MKIGRQTIIKTPGTHNYWLREPRLCLRNPKRLHNKYGKPRSYASSDKVWFNNK